MTTATRERIKTDIGSADVLCRLAWAALAPDGGRMDDDGPFPTPSQLNIALDPDGLCPDSPSGIHSWTLATDETGKVSECMRCGVYKRWG